jgi:RNA polymerase sigma-70 factor (ECF subfamily)
VRITVSGDAADDVDRRLIERLAAGELEALSELYERHKTMAFSIAIRVTGNEAAAEDAVQDAFLGAWRSAGRYVAGRASVRTWLLTIVHRRAIDTVRRRRRPDATVELDADVAESLAVPDVWQEVAQGLDRATVSAALEQISAVQRQAIELAYFEGLTQTEIATRTTVPLGTVKSRLRLGLLGMRRALTAAGEEPDSG